MISLTGFSFAFLSQDIYIYSSGMLLEDPCRSLSSITSLWYYEKPLMITERRLNRFLSLMLPVSRKG